VAEYRAIRVLLADTPEQVEMYAAAFERAGDEVIAASDGYAALAAVERYRPDVVVLEVRLPLLDGWEVCHRLKLNPVTAHIPVIVLTTAPLDSASLAVQSTGAAVYRSKPCDPIEVLAMVRTVLNRQPA
jgi:two-component system sensor histidine kinase/response regulator